MKSILLYKSLIVIGLLAFILVNYIPKQVLANNIDLSNDPTRPKLPSNNQTEIKNTIKKKAGQVLQAILKRNNEYIAIIEDKVYQKNDYYLGHKIIEIKSNKVKILTNSGIEEFSLFPKIKINSDG